MDEYSAKGSGILRRAKEPAVSAQTPKPPMTEDEAFYVASLAEELIEAGRKHADAIRCDCGVCVVCRFRARATAKELAELQHNIASGWNIVEIAVRNRSVAEYCEHWEGRTLAAEAKVADLTRALAERTQERDEAQAVWADYRCGCGHWSDQHDEGREKCQQEGCRCTGFVPSYMTVVPRDLYNGQTRELTALQEAVAYLRGWLEQEGEADVLVAEVLARLPASPVETEQP